MHVAGSSLMRIRLRFLRDSQWIMRFMTGEFISVIAGCHVSIYMQKFLSHEKKTDLILLNLLGAVI